MNRQDSLYQENKFSGEFPFWYYKLSQLAKREIDIVADSFSYHIIGETANPYSHNGMKKDFDRFFHELIDKGILKYPLERNFDEILDGEKIYPEHFFDLLREYGIDFIKDIEWLIHGHYNFPWIKSNGLRDNLKEEYSYFINLLNSHEATFPEALKEFYFNSIFDFDDGDYFNGKQLMIPQSVFTEKNKGVITPSKNEIKRYSRHGLTGINLKEIHKSKYLHGTIDLSSIINIKYPKYYWIKGNRNDRSLCLILADDTVYQKNLPSMTYFDSIFGMRYFDKEWSRYNKSDNPKYKLNFIINEFFQITTYWFFTRSRYGRQLHLKNVDS